MPLLMPNRGVTCWISSILHLPNLTGNNLLLVHFHPLWLYRHQPCRNYSFLPFYVRVSACVCGSPCTLWTSLDWRIIAACPGIHMHSQTARMCGYIQSHRIEYSVVCLWHSLRKFQCCNRFYQFNIRQDVVPVLAFQVCCRQYHSFSMVHGKQDCWSLSVHIVHYVARHRSAKCQSDDDHFICDTARGVTFFAKHTFTGNIAINNY